MRDFTCLEELKPPGVTEACRRPSIGAVACEDADDISCCGDKTLPPAGPEQRAGYSVLPFVAEFLDTPAGLAPLVSTRLSLGDYWQSALARTGAIRDCYAIAPGLYAVGQAGPQSPVLATANYKLTFDSLRKELEGVDAWILVLDTRGVNVWCAAGKKTFSTDEVLRSIQASALATVVSGRSLILPQLAAPGVSAREVKRRTGFNCVWGPVRAGDIPAFLAEGGADEHMRQVTFSLGERAVLIPVELYHLRKTLLWLVPVLFAVSGVGLDVFSFSDAWIRGLYALMFLAVGIVSGAAATPLLLPWLPGRAFAAKGAVMGLASGLAVAAFMHGLLSPGELAAAVLFCTAVSSFLGMNFTGSTPYTSPSGVEKEMRWAIPFQAAATATAFIVWVWAHFV